jgi:hypothetical protein
MNSIALQIQSFDKRMLPVPVYETVFELSRLGQPSQVIEEAQQGLDPISQLGRPVWVGAQPLVLREDPFAGRPHHHQVAIAGKGRRIEVVAQLAKFEVLKLHAIPLPKESVAVDMAVIEIAMAEPVRQASSGILGNMKKNQTVLAKDWHLR